MGGRDVDTYDSRHANEENPQSLRGLEMNTADSQQLNTIRVLHLVESYASGVATAVSEYIRNTPEFDHAVIARARRGFDVSSSGLDDRTHLLSANTSIWRLITASRKKIVEFSPDVIHCHSSEAGVYGRLLAARYRTPAIYSPHAFAFIREDVPKWRRRIFRSVERLLSSTTAAFVTAGSAETALVRQLTARKPTYEAHPYVTILDRQSSHQKKDIDIVTTGRDRKSTRLNSSHWE